MSLTLFEIIGKRRRRVFRDDAEIQTLVARNVTESQAELRGRVIDFFPPAFGGEEKMDIYFAYSRTDGNGSVQQVFAGTVDQNGGSVTETITGLDARTEYEYFAFGKIGVSTISPENSETFTTGVFRITTTGVLNVGKEQATLEGELDKFDITQFGDSGPFNIQSKNGSFITVENTEPSNLPLFVLDDLTDNVVKTSVNTSNRILTIDGSSDTSFKASSDVQFTFDVSEGSFDLDPDVFDFNSGVSRDVQAGFEYKSKSAENYKTIFSPIPPSREGDTFSATVQNLQQNSDYTFRAFGRIGSFNRVRGNDIEFSTLKKEVVDIVTLKPISVSINEAKIKGEIKDQNIPLEAGFNWGTSVGNNQTQLESVSSPTTFTRTLTALNAGTTYEYQAYAENQSSHSGEVFTFTTKAVIVETDLVNNVTEGSAVFSGIVKDLNPVSPAADVHFDYGKQNPPQLSIEAGSAGSGDSFTATPTGLDAGTEYNFQAVATDPDTGVTSTGDIQKFETTNVEVETLEVGSIDQNEATLVGRVINTEGSAPYDVFFRYRKDGESSFIKTLTQTVDKQGPFIFEQNIDSLEDATIYEYQAVVVKNTAEEEGDIKKFQTNSVKISTTSSVNVKAGGATLNGELQFISSKVSDVAVSFRWRKQGTGSFNQTFFPSSPVSSLKTFSADVTGLDAGRTYEFQAVADPNSKKQQTGDFFSFKTVDLSVQTKNIPADRDVDFVLVEGMVNEYGGSDPIEVGHQFIRVGGGNISTTGTKVQSADSPVGVSNTFQTKITGLSAGTKYDVRAYASVGGAVMFGKIQRVSTKLNE